MERSIGQIVADDYRSAAVFDRYGIDFCCNGDQSLETACQQKQLDIVELRKLLHTTLLGPKPKPTDFKSWPLDLLINYIEKKHHRYTVEKIPVIHRYLNDICREYGAQHPELNQIFEIFITSSVELRVQMEMEELVLFPFIQKMLTAKYNSKTLHIPHFAPINIHVLALAHNHRIEGKRLRKIEALSHNYTPPEDSSKAYKKTFVLLREFYKDLQFHIHLENNILFPKSTLLEKEFRTSV
ncbi:DUF542 domain-containing protein [Flavobacteriaceae bacterium F89]|uniref:DUF542 domain-containing protein n=1 Tax=Cerina litoralis TaxID=2874477 RepID=A0AAE3EX74_9FLAO|nr:DUF542 domain-containing protein [Cerina litoralis]MCG2462533.1 DUF542 domain-containing protein [Cerina litoralis]